MASVVTVLSVLLLLLVLYSFGDKAFLLKAQLVADTISTMENSFAYSPASFEQAASAAVNRSNTTSSLQPPINSTIMWANVSTAAWTGRRFYSGYRNQMFAFTVLMIDALNAGHGQFLVDTIAMKDTYGTNKAIPFEMIWDVPHFNSFYPSLPRLVKGDQDLLDQYDVRHNNWNWKDGLFYDKNWQNPVNTTTRPFRVDTKQHHMFGAYKRYTLGKTNRLSVVGGGRHPAEVLMLQDALRPNPELQKIIDDCREKHGIFAEKGGGSYMALHARVEPDMQKHPVCRDKKVLKLAQIFEFMEAKWPEPPISKIFMPINRQELEKEGVVLEDRSKTNWIAVGNLKALNDAVTKGLWGGRVKVFEFGANALKGTAYEEKPSTSGAALNYFLSLEADIFIGTEISTYSHDILATRFFRNRIMNFKYLPSGLEDWTPPGTKQPPGFSC